MSKRKKKDKRESFPYQQPTVIEEVQSTLGSVRDELSLLALDLESGKEISRTDLIDIVNGTILDVVSVKSTLDPDKLFIMEKPDTVTTYRSLSDYINY